MTQEISTYLHYTENKCQRVFDELVKRRINYIIYNSEQWMCYNNRKQIVNIRT